MIFPLVPLTFLEHAQPTLFAVQSSEQGAAHIRVHAPMGVEIYAWRKICKDHDRTHTLTVHCGGRGNEPMAVT